MLRPALAAIGVLTFCAFGQADEANYEEVWHDVTNLLKYREYDSAVDLLDAARENRELAKQATQIQADRTVVQGLVDFEELVNARCASLKPGDRYKAGGIEYTFVKFKEGAIEETLVVKASNVGREREIEIKDLAPSAWLDLAGPQLDTLQRKDLVVGAFLAFDRYADANAARKLFDKAAATGGSDIGIWVKRLEAAEEERKTGVVPGGLGGNQPNVDPLIGKWRIVHLKNPKKKKEKVHPPYNVVFKKNGTVDPSGNWELADTGIYRWTKKGGITYNIQMHGDGVEFTAYNTAGQKIRGSRQVVRSAKK